jgi:hypothetical protein
MSHIVNIYDELTCNINPSFVRANGFLIEKYKNLFVNQSTHTNKNILKELWLSEFKAQLIAVDQIWKDIEFNSDHEKMMFLLRWG